MASKLKLQNKGALARAKLLNEVIQELIPLRRIRVEWIEEDQVTEVVYSDNNVVFKLPRSAAGGGLPDGFGEETLDVVEDDNTPGQRVFLTKEAN